MGEPNPAPASRLKQYTVRRHVYELDVHAKLLVRLDAQRDAPVWREFIRSNCEKIVILLLKRGGVEVEFVVGDPVFVRHETEVRPT